MSLLERIERLSAGIPKDISRFTEGLDPEWIEECLEATGSASVRKRKLPASKVLWLVMGMALFADRSIQRVVEHLNLTGIQNIRSSAVAQARKKLGSQPLIWLFSRVVKAWATINEKRWCGLSLYGVDGSHLRVDDSDENNAFFGRPKGRAEVGYPQLRMVALMNLTSRMVTGAALGPWATGEVTLARNLWEQIPENSLTIVDRGFLAYAFFFRFLGVKADKHFLVRLKKNTKYRVERILSDGSALASIQCPKSLRIGTPSLPAYLTVRLIEYQHKGADPSLLMTSLLDYKKYACNELILVYHQRWELEIAFDEIKTHMLQRKEALRSRTVEGVHQEFWGILLVYNLIRREMAAVADERDVISSRISFVGSMLLIQNFFISSLTASPGTLPKELCELEERMTQQLMLPPRRRERRVPRQVKIKMSQYPKAPPRVRQATESLK